MSVAEILEQVKELTLAERRAVAKGVIDLLGESGETRAPKTGAEIVALLEALGAPIELVDPEIQDPVEWVKAQRRKRQAKLNSYGGGEA